jgi:hypothetical protein
MTTKTVAEWASLYGVAYAICAEEHLPKSPEDIYTLFEVHRDRYMRQAHAAISALQMPSKAMTGAGLLHRSPQKVFGAMIQVLLG